MATIRFSKSDVDWFIRTTLSSLNKEATDLTNEEIIQVMASVVYESVKKYGEELVDTMAREAQKYHR